MRVLGRFSLRERRVMTVGATLAVLILGYFIGLEPTLERMSRLDRLIPQKEAQVEAFGAQRAKYLALSQTIRQVERQMDRVRSPLVFVEEIAAQNQLRGNIVSIRPLPTQARPPYQEVSAEVKMEKVRLAQIIPFLREVEQAPARIRRLDIKARFSDPNLLDVTFVVAAYNKKR